MYIQFNNVIVDIYVNVILNIKIKTIRYQKAFEYHKFVDLIY